MQHRRLSDSEIQNVCRNLILRAAPEREDELEKLWREYEPCFKLLKDTESNEPEIRIRPFTHEIEFNLRLMRVIWLAAFIAQEAFREVQLMYTRNLIDSDKFDEIFEMFLILFKRHDTGTGKKIPTRESTDSDRSDEISEMLSNLLKQHNLATAKEILTKGSTEPGRFDEMLKTLFEILDPQNKPWDIEMPKGVPEPSDDLDAREPHEQAPIDLATLAVGWAFLHEIKHLQNLQKDTNAKWDDPEEEWHKEEFECDEFATTFLLKKVEQYARMKSVAPQSIKRKRTLGIYYALFAMTLKKVENWKGSNTHPAMQDRIDATQKLIDDSGVEVSSWIAHDTFFRLRLRWPKAPGPFRSQ